MYPDWEILFKSRELSRGQRFKNRFKKIEGYFFWGLIPSSILFLFLHLKGDVLYGNIKYILSSIAQGLASLFALLFVIIFFLCQSTKRVSILSQFLKPDGFILLGFFTFSIILPLIIMRINYYNFLVDLSISVALFCLLSLIPFIMKIRATLEQFGISNIVAELNNINFSKEKIRYGELIDDLQKIGGKRILSLGPNIVVDSLIRTIEDIFLESALTLQDKIYAMIILSELAAYSLILYRINRYIHDNIKDKIFVLLSFIDNEEFLKLGYFGIVKILSIIKSEKLLSSEVRLHYSGLIIMSLFKVFKKRETIEKKQRGVRHLLLLQENIEIAVITILQKGLLYSEDLKEALNKHWESLINNAKEKWRGKFDEYIENLLDKVSENN